MSPRTGRPKSNNPKKATLTIRLTQEEAAEIERCAKLYGTTRTSIVLMGIKKLLAEKE